MSTLRGQQLNETGHDQNRADCHNTTLAACHTGRSAGPIRYSPTAPPPSGWTLALLAALLAAAPVAAQTDVWSATLTPADFSGSLGCNNASAIATSKCSTATVLSDDDFTYDSTDYSVTVLFLTATAFTFTVDTDITAATNALTVVVGGTSLAFADAGSQTARTRTWFNPSFSWTAGTAVSIRITGPTPIVPPDWSLKPTGLAEGSQFRLLFLSSTKRDATATDIADYNTFVQDRAEAGHTDIQGYSAGFRAVGCTADTDARDNTATTGTGVPIYWLNGTKAADDYADFYDGDWDDEANDKNESGTDAHDTALSVNHPYTGCQHNGTESSGTSRALGTSNVSVGIPNSSTSGEGPIGTNANFRVLASNTRPMYGLSAVFQVLVVAPSLTSAVVLADGNTIQLAFSEDLQSANLPPAAAFTVTNGGTAVTVTGVAAGSTEDVLEITVSPLIGQGQAVVVAYEDPTDGDDAKAIQDTVGNDTPDFTTGSGDVPAVTNNSALTNEVLASWSLTPAGLAVGTKFRLLFLSSTKRDALSSDIADYNTFVQDRAAAGHAAIQAYSGGFGAIGCTGAVDARDNTSTTGTGVPIYWLDGTKVADDYADFYDGSWDDEANDKNESGTDAHDTSQENNYPITGCMDDGTESFAGAPRPRSLGAPLGLVRIGRLNASGSVQDPIDGNDVADTDATRPMYGLSAVFEVSSSPSTNPNAPAAVSDVAVVPVRRTSDSLTVSWSAPDNTGKPALNGYDVRYGQNEDNWTTVRQNDAASTTLIITGLSPNNYYDVQVRALNANGSGPWSSNAEGATIFPAETVLANHPLVPDDLGPGDSFRLLFITEETTDATDTGIHDYHDIAFDGVVGIGDPGGLLNDWGAIIYGQVALLSTPGADARLITDTTWDETDPGVPIYWVNGARVADDYADFYDGTWADEANPTSGLGQPHSLADPVPWTGTDHDGTELIDGTASRAVGQSTVGVGAPGSTASGAGPLNGDAAFASTQERPLYGLWHVLVVDENLRLVTNFFQPEVGNVSNTRAAVRAQLFTTGPHSSGYGISSIEVEKGSETATFLGTVAIHTTDGDGDPDLADGLHATLSLENTGSSTWTLAAPAGTVLKPSTTYALVFKGDAGTYPELYATPADGEDSPADGWSLADALVYYTGSAWVENTDGTSLVIEMIGPLAAVTTAVPNNWSLIPTGLNTGDQFRLLFLSSTKRTATATAIADYNTFVQTRAAAGHADIRAYSAGFRAVGCTSAVDARDNTTTTGTGVPIYWLGGAKVADDYADFYDGSWDDEANDKNESGADGPQNVTGTSAAIASLTASTSHQVQVRATNAEGDGDWSFAGTGRTGNNAPVFSSSTAARSVAENTAAGQNVGAVLTATDLDSDTLIYTLEGTDAASFGILSASGQIQTKAGVTYNHEAKATYTVIVKADDSNGGTATVTVTITVTDVNEPPGVPAAPSVTATAGSSTSLDVSWTAPTNTGPAIASYDLQYREGTSGSFTAGPQDVTGTSAAIASLTASTSHQVQVRATNAEGDSDWSPSGPGRTGNNAPVFSSSTAARSVAENTAAGQNVGAVLTATDLDSDTLIYTLEGTDAASFGILSASGQIQTKAGVTYNHEAKATYTVIVKADDSNGGTATVTVTITVTDVNEPPGVPAAPSVSGTTGSTTSLDVSWTAPTNTGPAIASYDLQYREGTSGAFTDGPQNVTGTSAAIASLMPGTSHQVQVRATNAEGDGDWSPSGPGRTGTSVPGAPTGLMATANGNTQIDLSWTAPGSNGGSAITGYRIEESPNGNSNWTTLEANTSGPGTTYSHTGLAAGTTRHYRVSAINSNGAGAASNVDDATTGTTVPGAPTSLVATASGNTRINLSWTAPAITGGSPITGYKIEVSPDGNSNWSDLEASTNSPATTYVHTGLAAGTTRHYRVSAINTNGAGAASSVDDATTGTTVPGAPSNVDGATTGTTVPDAPTVLTATASGTTRINLSWTAPASDGGSPITGYRIESSPNGNSSWTVLVATTGGASTTHSDTGLPGGTTRHYRVSAINTNGAGLPSNVAGTTTGTSAPGAPTSLTATASGTARINLSWTAPARDGGTRITGYRIEQSPDGTSSWTDLVTNTTNTRTTYSHTGLSGGTTRHYRVSAINSNGAGAPSSVDSATTGTSVPGAPTALSARASGTTQVDLSWTAPASDGGSPVTGYRIEESPNGRSGWTVLVATTGSPATTYSRTGLPSGATRHYRVSAVNTNGAGAASNTASTTTGTTVPDAPTSLTAAASGTARIDLSWTAPASDGGIRITGYRIESSLGSGSSWTVLVADTTNTRTTYSDTGLSGGTTRYYRVSAINTNGTGAHSNIDGATTGTTVPDAPTDLTATVSEKIRINLSWARPASDGGSFVTGYRIEISSDGGSSWTDLVANTRSPHRAYSHTVGAGATRHYRVSAISAIGTSAHSNVASATAVLRTVRFGAELYTAREGGAAATVAVVLSAAAPAPVTIPLTREHLSGATEADYSGVPAGVTFAAGQARQTFTVTVTEDSDEDGLKRLRLQFGTLPSGYASRPPRTAVVRLVDNDGGLAVGFGTERHTTVRVREHADVRHRFSVYLHTNRYGPPNNNRQQALTIPLEVTHVGGAEEDVDYTPRIPASVTFAAGQSEASFSIRAIPDGERESGEGLRIDFGPLPSGVARGEWGPYETIEFVDQVLPEYTAQFGAAEYTATEGGGGARVTIHLSAEVEIEPAEVRLQVEHGGGATAADYSGIPARVTFLVGERTQTITVTATNDTDDDDGESVTLSFVNDPNGRVSTGNGPNSATVALADNDGAERVTVSFGAGTYTATEGGSAATVSVELDAAPGRSVTVPLTTELLGGATVADYSGIPGSVTIAADQKAATFTVIATAGDGGDGGESVSIGFGSLPEAVRAGSPATATVTLADGSEQSLVVEFDTRFTFTVQVREGARRKRLRVLLNQSARRPVTIPLVVQHVGGATEADYTGIPESVTIAAGEKGAPYYVQALPDEEEETGEGLRLDFGPLPPGVKKGAWGPYETIAFLDAGAPAPANLSVAGRLLTLGYHGALDGGSTPSGGDFVVSAEARGGEQAMVAVAAVAVRGSDVFLELDRPVLPDETVTLSYLAAPMHPIREAAGRPAPPLADEPVRNDTEASGALPPAGLAARAAIAAPLAARPPEAPGGAGTERLDLSSRNLTDLTVLAGRTGLRELDLRDNAIEDLGPLAELAGLERLYLAGNRIADLRPLAGLTALERLNLSANRIEQLWPLAGLSGLEVLLLDRNRVADVLAIAPLARLAHLGLAGNRIADVGLLAELGWLRRLDLSGNAVTDVSALGDVAGLVWLRLPGNPVSSAAPLERLENLRWLWIDPGTAPGSETLAPPAGQGAAPLWIQRSPAR